jgi:hypothetical protein
LTCIDNIFSSRSIEVGDIDNGAALNTHIGVASGRIDGHTIEISGELRFISEGCGMQ